jgi:lysophospholipase L1-like esterase
VDLPDGTRRLEVAASLGEVRLYGVDLTSGARGVVYDTLGLNGGRAAAMLQWNEALMTQQLARLAPDLIIIAFGSNEVDNERLTRTAFAATFMDVLKRLRRMTPGASCLVLGPTDQARLRRRQGWVVPEQLAIIVDEQRRVAKQQGCAFLDQQAAMGGHGSVAAWTRSSPQLAQTDRVHLTGEGYRQLGAALFQSVMTHLARYQPGR